MRHPDITMNPSDTAPSHEWVQGNIPDGGVEYYDAVSAYEAGRRRFIDELLFIAEKLDRITRQRECTAQGVICGGLQGVICGGLLMCPVAIVGSAVLLGGAVGVHGAATSVLCGVSCALCCLLPGAICGTGLIIVSAAQSSPLTLLIRGMVLISIATQVFALGGINGNSYDKADIWWWRYETSSWHSFLRQPRTIVRWEGDEVFLNCTLKQLPSKSIAWSRNHEPLKNSSFVYQKAIVTDGTLTIPNLSPRDTGMYKCAIVEGSKRDFMEFRLTVFAKSSTTPAPELLSVKPEREEVNASQDAAVTFKCRVDSRTPCLIQWVMIMNRSSVPELEQLDDNLYSLDYKDHLEMDRMWDVHATSRSYPRRSDDVTVERKLSINHVRRRHGGVYACVVSNPDKVFLRLVSLQVTDDLDADYDYEWLAKESHIEAAAMVLDTQGGRQTELPHAGSYPVRRGQVSLISTSMVIMVSSLLTFALVSLLLCLVCAVRKVKKTEKVLAGQKMLPSDYKHRLARAVAEKRRLAADEEMKLVFNPEDTPVRTLGQSIVVRIRRIQSEKRFRKSLFIPSSKLLKSSSLPELHWEYLAESGVMTIQADVHGVMPITEFKQVSISGTKTYTDACAWTADRRRYLSEPILAKPVDVTMASPSLPGLQSSSISLRELLLGAYSKRVHGSHESKQMNIDDCPPPYSSVVATV